MGTSADIGTSVDRVSEIVDGKFSDAVRNIVDFDAGMNIWEFTDKKEKYLCQIIIKRKRPRTLCSKGHMLFLEFEGHRCRR